MRSVRATAVCFLLLILAVSVTAQQKDSSEPSKPTDKGAQATEKSGKLPADAEKGAPKEEPPIVTHHEIHLGGRVLHYTATAGYMPIRNEEGTEVEANIFFVAYTLDSPAAKRPLMFSFNGGPGSASIWLHLGAIGPRKVQMQPEGFLPAPPYHVVDNENTWLTKTDLGVIDPISTGYSRVTKPELLKKYLGLKGDTSAVGEFIRHYLDRYERWSSPLFLVGESYGTTRASALSGLMLERYGVSFNGIVLVSAVLNFE